MARPRQKHPSSITWGWKQEKLRPSPGEVFSLDIPVYRTSGLLVTREEFMSIPRCSKRRTACSLRFHSGCLDDALCAFALLHDEARELRLCHAHPIGPMLFQPSAQFRRSHDPRDVLC